MNSNTAVIIPAYNEEKTIKKVVNSVKNIGTPVVVNDCSSDATAAEAINAGAEVISNTKNLGYEKSIVVGLEHSIKKKYRYSITVDADGQHAQEDVMSVRLLLEDGYEIVVGVRVRMQRYSEYLIGFIGSLFWGIKDPLCGLKGYDLKALEISNLYSYESIGTELAVTMVKSGRKFSQFDIETCNRFYGQSTFGGNSFKTNVRFLKCFMNNFIKSSALKNNEK
tara:strand:- start:991 stop:1659 length:669 start_codon:yes stop_codon:yes gene_type:complete